MFARVSTYEGAPGLTDDQVQEIVRRQTSEVLPTVREMTGFQGVMSLLDRSTGKAVSITLWDSEEDMKGSEEAANATRAQAAQIADEQIAGVERYEVIYQEMS